ncbi:glycoside hydrolase family protein [Arthrobacter sp. PAMC 25486]|uniref:glycoside hydrolase family 5 protein n=1 Tax=Arthrobacter sp. PAMC 25486 TaxID=1494608 RepID=UPI000536025E|nr:cellulase family glycosylhydrolase [Arthrobacter sp. PAMC 25486]AIY01526.1 glycoside hydrolase family protein [Arthrobacter sp. PAMC 25486]
MRIVTDGTRLRDEHGRERVFHGINLVAKGDHEPHGSFIDRGFKGTWTKHDLEDLAARGFTLVRLGVMWAAVEPEPGAYDKDYLDWIVEQLDLIHDAGMAVLLDSHQDLYSQSFGDGAPYWATLSGHQFAATELWSDAYLTSAALHEALDAFWTNAPGPGGVGLQERFAAMWAHVAAKVGEHPAVVGYDLLNEPAPGSAAPDIFAALIGTFATVTGQDPHQVFADFEDPDAKLAQLARLEDEDVYRKIGDATVPLVQAFETDSVGPMMERVAAAVRAVDGETLLAREHSYFANMGVPSGQPALADTAWVYSPHGYDLTVDSPAIALSSNIRAGVIFSRHKETQNRLAVPVIVGEWGALSLGEGVHAHGEFLLDLFDSYGWSWTYWVWEPGFAGSEAAATLDRPRPIAFAGTAQSWRVEGKALHATWEGQDGEQPSVFFVPEWAQTQPITVRRDGVEIAVRQDGPWISVDPGLGYFELSPAR